MAATIMKYFITLWLFNCLAFATIELNNFYYFTQTTQWNHLKIDFKIANEKYIRIWVEVIDKPKDSSPLLALSDTEPHYGANSTDVQATYIDYEGWFSNLNYHSIILENSGTLPSIISVGNYDYKEGAIQYKLRVDASDSLLCPQDCNNNGACQALNQCSCNPGYIKPTCGIPAVEILPSKTDIKNPINGFTYGYISLANISSSSIVLNINWDGPYCRLLLNYDGSGNFSLPSSHHFYLSVFLNGLKNPTTATIDISDMNDFLYVAAFPLDSYKSTASNYTIWYEEKSSDDASVFILIYIIISCVGVITVLFGLFFIFKKKCKEHHLVKVTEESPGLSSSLINKKYPAFRYYELKSKEKVEITCAICFDAFHPTSWVRKLHCSHLFHSTCIEEWFKANTTCCLCKRDCSAINMIVLSNFGEDENLFNKVNRSEINTATNITDTFDDSIEQV
ncbi:unnamed protein product [Blepharisma stoltei]|uniref:RING-type domain-containing protein n=1 Tax=Blepharisma stoltei TaxID=1481888 RepID=A0AAU9K961_9CILI|nr:unnamed protein product [Blepharisma stoltei]